MATALDFTIIKDLFQVMSITGIDYIIALASGALILLIYSRNPRNWAIMITPIAIFLSFAGIRFGTANGLSWTVIYLFGILSMAVVSLSSIKSNEKLTIIDTAIAGKDLSKRYWNYAKDIVKLPKKLKGGLP